MREQVCLQHALRWQAEDGGDTVGTLGLGDIQQLAEAVGGTETAFGQSLADGDGSWAVSLTLLRAHQTDQWSVCRLVS